MVESSAFEGLDCVVANERKTLKKPFFFIATATIMITCSAFAVLSETSLGELARRRQLVNVGCTKPSEPEPGDGSYHKEISMSKNSSKYAGAWVSDNRCKHEPFAFACTPNGMSWESGWPEVEPCDYLKDKHILYVGDSFARHAYTAFILWLTGNYQNGALKEGVTGCDYSGQFEKQMCRHDVVSRIEVCGGSVALKYGIYPTVTAEELNSYDFVVLTVGRHPVDGNYSHRYGQQDAGVISREYFQPMCSSLPRQNVCRKLIWLDAHDRLLEYHHDETFRQNYDFLFSSRAAIFRDCGVRSFASAWEASEQLVSNYPEQASNMSFDGVHWGMGVNLIKSFSIFSRMLSISQLDCSRDKV